MDEAGLETCVVGVSGGIDSAAVLRLCERTNKRVVAVAMPMSVFNDSNSNSLQQAMDLCVGRDVEFHIRPIGDIVEAYKKQGHGIGAFGPAPGFGPGIGQLSEGNLRSRIRADILRGIAGETKGLVIGTGNLDEDAIGYFTKGGDGDVDLCPLSKIHKATVYEMAELLQVPKSILTAKPTAGLWDGQTDEDELGMTYDEIAWAIDFDITGTNENALNLREKDVLKKVRHLRKINAHKLSYPPVFDPSEIIE